MFVCRPLRFSAGSPTVVFRNRSRGQRFKAEVPIFEELFFRIFFFFSRFLPQPCRSSLATCATGRAFARRRGVHPMRMGCWQVARSKKHDSRPHRGRHRSDRRAALHGGEDAAARVSIGSHGLTTLHHPHHPHTRLSSYAEHDLHGQARAAQTEGES